MSGVIDEKESEVRMWSYDSGLSIQSSTFIQMQNSLWLHDGIEAIEDSGIAEIGIALARSTGPGGKALDSFCDIVTDVVSGVA